MIQSTNLRELSMMDFYQVLKSVLDALAALDFSSNRLRRDLEEMQRVFTAYDTVLKPAKSSEHTQEIRTLDEQRDNLVLGMGEIVRAYLRFPDEVKAKASRLILKYLNTYGTISELPYRDETAAITNLVQDFRRPDVEHAVSLLGIEEWIALLTSKNQQLEALYETRSSQTYVEETGVSKKYRQELQELFTLFGKHLNAIMLLEETPDPIHEKASRAVNSIVQQAKDTQRSTGGTDPLAR